MGIRFSVCVEMVFPESPLEEKLERVAAAGFGAVEFWDWKDKPLEVTARRCSALSLNVTNMSGQRGGSLLARRDFEGYKSEVIASIGAAQKLSCPNLTLLTNPLGPDGEVLHTYSDVPEPKKRENCVEGLSLLSQPAAARDVRLLLEPLNTRIDHPGYWLDDAGRAFEIIREVGHPNVRLLYDIYHMRVMGRDVHEDIEQNLDLIGYFHAADFPGRHEPGAGTIDYRSIFAPLASSGRDITIGFEFSPAASSEHALESLRSLIRPFLDSG